MIRSMTGYGRGEVFLHNRKFIVEIKSVNHRYNDISIRLSKVLNVFEDSIRKIISSNVSRGKLDVYISFQSFSKADINIEFNESLADSYVDTMDKVSERYGFDSADKLKLLLSYPEVLSVNNKNLNDQTSEEIWEALSEALLISLEQFTKMRETEGENLKKDLLDKINAISILVTKIKNRHPVATEEIKTRMKTRIEDSLKDFEIDENRIMTEVIIIAEKASIDEELTRLESHISQLRTFIINGGVVGKKLDFIIQELNRETNTIGSKSNDIEIMNLVVELKSEIEKVREQIQNIE